MPLRMIRESALTMAKQLKQERPTALLLPLLLVYRGGSPVAVITTSEDGSQALMQIYGLAAWGYDADALALVVETRTRPAILVMVSNRADDQTAAEIGFRVRSTDIEWSEPTTWTPEGHWSAIMKRSMERPSASQDLLGQAAMPTRAQLDIQVTRQIQECGADIEVALMGDASDRDRLEELRRYGAN